MFVIGLISLVAVASAGVIQHEDGHSGHSGHPQATSYQLVKIENYQPVPIYIRKEHQQLLEHPVLKGHTATNLKLHHGSYQGKHHGGYAIASGTHDQGHQGHHVVYAAQPHAGQGLGAYAENPSHAYGGQQEVEYEQQGGGAGHDSAGYEQEGGLGAGYGHESAGYEQQEAGGATEGGHGQESAGYGQQEQEQAQQQEQVQDSGYDHQAYAQAVAEHARHQAASAGEHGHPKYQH